MTSSRPLAIDLFTGLHGWAEGLIAEGWRVIGFDLEDMCAQFGVVRPEHVQLVIQDVLTLHGRQFKDAALIVASPPCQAYSYRAMPWKRAKALPPPDNSLFEACFRIQLEACEAAGHHIPLVVENVCGAQKWVGRARWHFGSFYLWGDVPALMPITRKAVKVGGLDWKHPDDPRHCKGQAFNPAAQGREVREGRMTKNDGGSWFAVAHNTTSGKGQNPDGRKTEGHLNIRDGQSHTRHLTNQSEHGVKFSQSGDAWFDGTPRDEMLGDKGPAAFGGSARKAASAHIAKIPLGLSTWIARAWHPKESATA